MHMSARLDVFVSRMGDLACLGELLRVEGER